MAPEPRCRRKRPCGPPSRCLLAPQPPGPLVPCRARKPLAVGRRRSRHSAWRQARMAQPELGRRRDVPHRRSRPRSAPTSWSCQCLGAECHRVGRGRPVAGDYQSQRLQFHLQSRPASVLATRKTLKGPAPPVATEARRRTSTAFRGMVGQVTRSWSPGARCVDGARRPHGQGKVAGLPVRGSVGVL